MPSRRGTHIDAVTRTKPISRSPLVRRLIRRPQRGHTIEFGRPNPDSSGLRTRPYGPHPVLILEAALLVISFLDSVPQGS